MIGYKDKSNWKLVHWFIGSSPPGRSVGIATVDILRLLLGDGVEWHIVFLFIMRYGRRHVLPTVVIVNIMSNIGVVLFIVLLLLQYLLLYLLILI